MLIVASLIALLGSTIAQPAPSSWAPGQDAAQRSRRNDDRELEERPSPGPVPESEGGVLRVTPVCALLSEDTSGQDDPNPTRSSWIFNSLNAEEMRTASEFTVRELDLFTGFRVTLQDDYLYNVELHPVNKTEALAFLDGLTSTPPPRYAQALVIRPSKGDIMRYRVGPFEPGSGLSRENATLVPLTADGQIPISHRPQDTPESREMSALVDSLASELRDVFLNLTGTCYTGDDCIDGALDYLPFPLQTPFNGTRHSVISWYFNPHQQGGSESFLFPVPVFWKIDHTSLNASEWTSYDYEFCGQGPFASAAELAEGLRNGSVAECPGSIRTWGTRTYDFTWSRTDPTAQESRRPRAGTSRIPGPQTFMLQGRRFSAQGFEVGLYGLRLRWQGWDFHVTHRDRTGLSLFDVKFLGERILYELSVQDQIVVYSGIGSQGQTIYLDSLYRLGAASAPLRKGRDCPPHAEYLPALIGETEGMTLEDAYCVFEQDNQGTDWFHRHYPSGRPYSSDSVRSTSLIIRTIATLSNYDYMYQFELRLDGTIVPSVTAAGYMMTVYWPEELGPWMNPFGTRVAPDIVAPLHDHLAAFKVDLDIAGVNNSIQVATVKAGTYEEALASVLQGAGGPPPRAQPGAASRVNGFAEFDEVRYMTMQSNYTEETAFRVTPAMPQVVKIVNPTAKNEFGYARGYAIVMDTTPHQLLRGAGFMQGLAWSNQSFAIVKRKDSEPFVSEAQLDAYQLSSPTINFNDILNGEALDAEQGEDLVAFVTIGFIHIPRSEDVPLITNHRASFMIKPVNYFNRLATLDLPDEAEDEFRTCVPDVGNEFQYGWLYEGGGSGENPDPQFVPAA